MSDSPAAIAATTEEQRAVNESSHDRCTHFGAEWGVITCGICTKTIATIRGLRTERDAALSQAAEATRLMCQAQRRLVEVEGERDERTAQLERRQRDATAYAERNGFLRREVERVRALDTAPEGEETLVGLPRHWEDLIRGRAELRDQLGSAQNDLADYADLVETLRKSVARLAAEADGMRQRAEKAEAELASERARWPEAERAFISEQRFREKCARQRRELRRLSHRDAQSVPLVRGYLSIIGDLESELAALRAREAPESAWARGWALGRGVHNVAVDAPPYEPLVTDESAATLSVGYCAMCGSTLTECRCATPEERKRCEKCGDQSAERCRNGRLLCYDCMSADRSAHPETTMCRNHGPCDADEGCVECAHDRPGEEKRCSKHCWPVTDGIIHAADCPIHGAPRPGQCKPDPTPHPAKCDGICFTEPDDDGGTHDVFHRHRTCPVHGEQFGKQLGTRLFPDPTPHPAVAMANELDAPGGPRCACGKPSASEDGTCADCIAAWAADQLAGDLAEARRHRDGVECSHGTGKAKQTK